MPGGNETSTDPSREGMTSVVVGLPDIGSVPTRAGWCYMWCSASNFHIVIRSHQTWESFALC